MNTERNLNLSHFGLEMAKGFDTVVAERNRLVNHHDKIIKYSRQITIGLLAILATTIAIAILINPPVMATALILGTVTFLLVFSGMNEIVSRKCSKWYKALIAHSAEHELIKCAAKTS